MFLTGGSIIGAHECTRERSDEIIESVKATLKKRGITGLIVCGDKKALSGVEVLSDDELKVIGIPAAIDNDVAYTDSTIGFDTVCNVVVDTIMNLRNTIMSQKCVAVVEVAGKACGDIAMNVGMASGTDYILVPEMIQDYTSPYDIDNLFDQIVKVWESGKHYIIVVVAEGVTRAYKDSDVKNIKELLLAKIDEYNKMLRL